MKKNNLVFVFTYNFPKPKLPEVSQEVFEQLTEQEKANFKALSEKNTNDRFVNLFSIPFESINTDSVMLKKHITELRNKLSFGGDTSRSPLIKLFAECLNSPRSKNYLNPVLKDVMCVDTNDFEHKLLN